MPRQYKKRNGDAQAKKEQSYFEKIKREQKKARDQQLRDILKNARGKGIYDPKSLKLTKYRRTKANKIAKEFGDLLDPEKFFYVKPDKKNLAKFKERANSLSLKTTRLGAFITREGHKRAAVKYDKKRDELYIERSGRTKRGPTKGIRYKTIMPLASIDELDKERDRIIHMAQSLGELKKGEYISFVVMENGHDGYSHRVFSNIHMLMNYLDQYKKTLAGRVQFYRHISIEKTTPVEWFKKHPTTHVGKKGRKERDRIRKLNKGE